MRHEEVRSKLRGEIVPVPTQFHNDLSVNYEGIRAHVEFLLDRGVKSLYLALAASEFEYMTLEERLRVTEVVSRTTAGRAVILAQAVGGGWIDEQISEARAMIDLGADALVIKPPNLKETQKFFGSKWARAAYSPDRHDDFFYRYIERIANATNTSIVYHDKPFSDGRSVSHELRDRIVSIDNVVGLKEHAEDPNVRREIYQRLGGKVVCFDGFSKATQLWARAWGAKARHTCWSWFDPLGDQEFTTLMDEGRLEQAQKVVDREWPLAKALITAGFHGYKTVMGFMGLPTGPARIPGGCIDDHDRETLRKAMIAAGLLVG